MVESIIWLKTDRQVQADGLVPGEYYILTLPRMDDDAEVRELVVFVGYSPCPATVIVLDRLKRRLYCGRERLFRVTIDTPNLDVSQE